MVERVRGFVSANIAVVLCIVALIIFSIFGGDFFLTPRNLGNISRDFSIDAPLVMGESLVLIGGGLDLSVGSVLSMAAAITMKLQPYGAIISVASALLFGLFTGILNGLLITKGGVSPFIATLGTSTIVYGSMLTYTGQMPTPGQIESFNFWGQGSISGIPTPTILSTIILIILTIYLKYTRQGRDLYAIGGNQEAAFTAGIPIQRRVFTSYVICGLMASLSGVLLASYLNSSTIHIGLETNLTALSAAVIGGASMYGGRGQPLGAFIGILVLKLISNGMNILGVNTYVQTMTLACVLISVVILDSLTTTHRRARIFTNSTPKESS